MNSFRDNMNTNEIVGLISALGLGSSLGAIIAAVVSSRSQKGKARAEAADLIMNAAERVGKMNAELHAEIVQLRGDSEDIHRVVYEFLAGRATREELIVLLRKTRR